MKRCRRRCPPVLVAFAPALLVALVGCASSPPPPAAARRAVADVADVRAVAADEPSAEPAPPATWDEAIARFGDQCPAPFFTLPTPTKRTIGGVPFTVHGSRLARDGAPTRTLTLGVLGTLKDASADTRANVERAARVFREQGVDLVLANGDLVGETADAVDAVVAMLGEAFPGPVLVHAGNSEWTTRFREAMAAAAARWPQIVDLNFVRDVDWSGIHLVSLPGYFNRRFLREGACHYDDDDLAALAAWVDPLVQAGQPVILSSHGPPQGAGAQAMDVIHDGDNVGDPALRALLDEHRIPFGVFSHILEAGGRAVDGLSTTTTLPLPMTKPTPRLYANVGAATAFPWQMLDGKTARGMAAVFRVERHDDGTADAKVTFLKLR
jgi:hypothetical protein